MRIISGKYKGKNINPPKNFKARPTTDFAKESLFNIISNNFIIEEIKVLDLFSGTGSISYEFASRGCQDITLVESNFKHISFIKNVIKELSLDHVKAIKGDAFKFLKGCFTTFDIIFADAPYDLEGIETIPEIVFEKNLIKNDGWLIVEHSDHKDLSKHPNFLEKRSYGSVNFSIFSKK